MKHWLFPVLAVALVASTVAMTRSYSDLEKKSRDSEALAATLGRLYENQQMNLALKSMQEGDVKEASRRLDVLLCSSILRLNEELDTADPRTIAFVQDAFRRMALVRPPSVAGPAADAGRDGYSTRAAAQKILARVLTSAETAQVR